MTATIPTGEPTELVRGDSAKWYVADSEYPPADGWAMVYYLVSAVSTRVSWTGFTNNGDGNYLVTLVKADTQNLIAGRWNWQRVATKATEQITRDSGDLLVIEGFASSGATASPFVDGRSINARILEQLQASMLARVSSGQASMSINGRSISWNSLGELQDMIHYYEAKVDAETGESNRKIRIRYGAA